MKGLRFATEEEFKDHVQNADLDETCAVLALDTIKGTCFAVVRFATEIDPMFFPEGMEDRHKQIFARDLETFLMARGVRKYYFNVVATDSKWRGVVEHFGAESTSTEPEIRYRKII